MKNYFQNLTAAALTCVAVGGITPTATQAEPMLGEIKFFAGDFAPRGWKFCDGQLLPIMENTALFSIIGCAYGGDCQATMGLPDMRGRAPVHRGSGPGLEAVKLGAKSEPSSAKGTDLKTTPWVGTQCIIAVQGSYPSRS